MGIIIFLIELTLAIGLLYLGLYILVWILSFFGETIREERHTDNSELNKATIIVLIVMAIGFIAAFIGQLQH